MKSISKSTITFVILIVLVIAQSIGLYAIWNKQQQSDKKLEELSMTTTETLSAIEANRMMAINEVQSAREAIRPLYNPAENMLLMPELKIKLPYNDTSRTIEYIVDDENIRVTSSMLVDYSYSRQLSCTQILRINFQSAETFNPWEELYATVDLGNDRKMHLLILKAFKNNEGSTEECESEVWNRVTPQLIADEFKAASVL